ncbi:MAG: hypothetical protein FWG74_00905, partial [Planctomycetes bacterium]|nr:hypothetical protein [Planctomycetota bacterium]
MNTAKARLLLVFIFLLAMRQLIMGAEDEQTGTSAPFVLEVGSGTVDVHCPDGRLVQSLPYSGDEPDDRNRDFFAFVRDLDFDGFSDVGILYSQGMQNIYYDAWLWRPDARVFVKYEEMHEVASPDFDADRKRVRSYAHVSATDNVTIDYAWENGRLVAVEQKIQEYSPETDTFSIRRYTRGDDGELRLVEEKTLSPEEMEGLADNAEDTDDRDSNAAPAADAILVNNLRFEIEAVYAHAPGHRPWKIAGPLVDGETARVDTSTLQGSRRLIVKKKDEHEETPPLQFFNTSYLGDVGRMELALRGGIPTLLTFEDGIFDAAMTGLPFGILLSFLELETGMDTAAYADLMMPLAADGWESYAFAVTSGDISWRLLPPGPVFRKGGDGRKYLSSIAFGADMMRHELFWFLDEFHAHRIAPKTLIMEDGTAYAFGEESRNHPNALPVEKTADETLLEILKKRLNEWIDLHGSPERGDMRLLLESPEALYELRINLDTEAAEWSFQRKGDEVMPKEFYLTLFADFPGETWKKEVGPLPVENEPASPSLIAFYLADELSAWTRFDFTLNDVIFGEDSITVDWSKESTLLAGLDDRAQNEEFPVYFHDAASLNWFMLDSLALTLKNNLDI